MEIEIDLHSGVPSYQQLAAQLRERILAGEYGDREPVPSITWLRQETGLAVGTIRHAIEVLLEEGLVHTVPGRGTFVTPENDRPRHRGG